MGLLDELYNDPNSMGLLSAGMGMMDAGGPSRMPVSLGQALNQGMRQGMGAYQNAQHNNMERQRFNSHQQITDMQINAAKKSIADQEAAKANLARYLGEMPDGEQKQQIVSAVQMGVPLSKVWEQLNKPKEDFTLSPGATRYGPNGAPIVSAPQERKAPEGMQYGADGSLTAIPGFVAMKSQIAAAGRSPAQATPYYSPVQTAQGVMAFNARTGRMEPVQVNGQTVVGAQADPTLQGKIAGAKEAGKSSVELQTEATKAIKKSDQLLAIAQQAKDLLDKDPTGSGIGAAVDAAGRMIGKTSESSKTAADLETISGWMVSNVPRMEGPQSNFDVQNYQTMAAKVGDRTVPVKERKSALNTLIFLQSKYKSLNQGAVNPPAAPSVDSLLDKYK
jgi:hypothetical protein